MSIFALGICLLILVPGISFAFEIVEPTEMQVYEVGTKINIVVKPSPGDKIISVGVGFDEIPFNSLKEVFAREFPISSDAIPGELEFKVDTLSDTRDVVSQTRKIKVILPRSVNLESLEIDPVFLYLQKLPIESELNDIRIYGTERIGVAGVYSDGYKRDIAPSSSGTTYRSSNESIVIVDTEGLAEAKAPGQAKIFVSNSGKEISIDVIVEEFVH